MKRLVVQSLAKLDEVVDQVLYRPAVVKAFSRLPRWWCCELAKASIALDERWHTGYWDKAGIIPGPPCEACGRRASIHVYGGPDADMEPVGDYLENRPVHTCGWCHLEGSLRNEADVKRALDVARAGSVSWRWRMRAASPEVSIPRLAGHLH